MKQHFWKSALLALGAVCLLSLSAGAAEAPAVTRGAFLSQLRGAHEQTFLEPELQDPVVWAQSAGIVRGYGAGELRLHQPLTRAQAAVLLYRYAETLAPAPELSADPLAGYEDAAAVPAWCRREVAWAVEGDLWFSGSDARLGPLDEVTAPEVEMMLWALFRGGAPLKADWAEADLRRDVRLCAEVSDGETVTVTLHNDGEEYLFYGQGDRGLYRQINGGWYAMSNGAATLLGYTLGPGGRDSWVECYWQYGQRRPFPAGEYRASMTVERYGEPHGRPFTPLLGTSLVTADFVMPEPKKPSAR